MASRSLPQHRPETGEFGRCTVVLPWGTKGHRAPQRCGMLPDDTCHRYYPCRAGCGPSVDFASCESRDRHEANEHGGGW